MYLSLQSLSCRRGGRLLFRNLSAELGPGGILMVRGPNGSGKSSLLRILAGFLAAESGGIAWRQTAQGPWKENGASACAAYIGHLNGVKPQLTVAENLRFWTALADTPGAAATALAQMGLAALADLQAGLLSAGQQRRLALCRLAVSGRPLWLLDEPEAALDAASRESLLRLLAEHRAAGGIAVIASHAMTDLPDCTALSLAPAAAATAERPA